ncbi:hypothetical protein GCM10009127_13610 [Alteraurantiacibacter aestuarii]|uniref:Phage tail protein n=1 Tax=Alteraurantiacibacter aestuarii TaxID=650004 RepID=A0A844ZR11_9SPHN|nr:hypothetical protein [Alteraurantiacibacter aestuarii]MXO88049.1 hypothetical protein [Alteraurantiacibacter aestuarii]
MMRAAPSFFDLLPELYRRADRLAGNGQLQALTGLLDSARGDVERDIQALYADWFVETCAPGVLGDLAQLAGWQGPPEGAYDARAMVASAAQLNQTRGTASAAQRYLSQLSGWPVSVRTDDAAGGAAITVWQARLRHLRGSTPVHARREGPHGRCFRLHPLGFDAPLYQRPGGDGGTDLATGPALERELGDDVLAAHVCVSVRKDDGSWQRLSLRMGELSGWYCRDIGEREAIVDPQTGRMLLGRGPFEMADILVDCTISEILPCDRRSELEPAASGCWVAHVHRSAPPGSRGGVQYFRSLREALDIAAGVSADIHIRLLDSTRQELGEAGLADKTGNCPPDPNRARHITIEARSGETPVIAGVLRFTAAHRGLAVALRGLTLDGSIEITGKVSAALESCIVAPIARMRSRDTMAPAIRCWYDGADRCALSLQSCAIGPIVTHGQSLVYMTDSVVDGYRQRNAVDGMARLHLTRSTIFGDLNCLSIEGQDSAFIGLAIAGEGAAIPGYPEGRDQFISSDIAQPGYAMPRRGSASLATRDAGNFPDIGATRLLDIPAREDLVRQAVGLDADAADGSSPIIPLGVKVTLRFIQQDGSVHD